MIWGYTILHGWFSWNCSPIRAQGRPITFEELHDLLGSHDAYLRRLETISQQLFASVNYSNRRTGSFSPGIQPPKGSSRSSSLDRYSGYAPPDLIYDDVLGSSGSIGVDGSRYYLILVDHLTNYIWIYPLETKSKCSHNFSQFCFSEC